MKGADSSMDTILQEISKEDALKRYLEGEDIQVLRPTTNGRLAMWSMSELFQGSRFLVNSCNEKPLIGPEGIAIPTESEVHLNDPGFTNIIDNLFESCPNTATSVSNEDLHTKITGSQMANNGDVYVHTDDKERKKRVRIDLGKLKSLKDAGWKQKDVAEELHCSIQSVRNYWNKV
mgnify:CR=1 FL=1